MDNAYLPQDSSRPKPVHAGWWPWAWRLSFVCLWLTGAARGFGQARSWHEETGFRWAELPVPSPGKTGFTLLAPEQTGVNFTNQLTEWQAAFNRVLLNGSGVAVGDDDQDGLIATVTARTYKVGRAGWAKLSDAISKLPTQ